MRRLAALVAAALVTATCARTGDPGATPSPSPIDASIPIPNLAGAWSGTIESPLFAARDITMTLTQTGVDCVDGEWQTVPPEWAGAVSGFALPNGFSGFLSLDGPPNGSGLCAGTNRTSGSSSANNLKWTVTYDGACAGGAAQTVTFRLHRPS